MLGILLFPEKLSHDLCSTSFFDPFQNLHLPVAFLHSLVIAKEWHIVSVWVPQTVETEKLEMLRQGSPTLLLESYHPADFSSNPNQTHLKQLIKVFRATWLLQTGVLQQSWNWSLQDGSSPGAGLEIPVLGGHKWNYWNVYILSVCECTPEITLPVSGCRTRRTRRKGRDVNIWRANLHT